MSQSTTFKALYQQLLEVRERYKEVQTRNELEVIDREMKRLLGELVEVDPTFGLRREEALRKTVMEIQDFMAPYESKIKTAVNKARIESEKARAEADAESACRMPSPNTVTFTLDPSTTCKLPSKRK